MVEIVTGSGLGLERDSASVLGNAGRLGSASVGQAGLGVTVNAANGNLVLQSTDEILLGVGLDDIVTNTYNSQGTFTANGWQESFQRHVGGLTGTVNTSGSTVTRYAADGSAVVYTYNSSKGLYVGNEAGGAYDTLSFSSSSNQWTWTEGKTRIVEVYDNASSGRLVSSADADGNTLTYTYTGSLLTRITTADGEYTTFSYTGTLLTSVATYGASNNLMLTRVRYGYDTSNRLQTVTVDLSPGDNSVSDGKTYVTTYGYDGTSNRVASISQSDGTRLQIAYTLVGSVYKVSSLTQSISVDTSGQTPVYTNRTTTFDYSVAGCTTVTDSQGNATVFVYDSNGQLTQLVSPAPASGGAVQATSFVYDGNGNLLWSGPTGDPGFTNIGQTWNDLYKSDANLVTAQSTEMDGGVPVYRRQSMTTPAAGTIMRLGQSRSSWTAVKAGQSVQFSLYAASTGTSYFIFRAIWMDANGNWLQTDNINGLYAGGVLGANGVSTARFDSGTLTAPANAAYVEMAVDAVADGTGPMNVAIAQPTVAVGGTAAGGAVPPSFTYTYDSNGNLLTKSDTLGNQTVFVYDSNNQLLTRTEYPAGGTALTTRYVYDAESHLAFTISPAGEVTEHIYNAAGQETTAWAFTSAADIYPLTGLTSSQSPSLTTMNTWATNIADKVTIRRTDTTYDSRGAIKSVTTYSQTDSAGAGVAGTGTTTNYTYDTWGRLVSRQLASGGTETYVYDGLERMLSLSDLNGKSTLTTYANQSASGTATGAQVQVTLANGAVQTSIYDLAGEVIRSMVSGTDSVGGATVTATTTYAYDSNGNLVRVTDPTSVRTYYVYDAQNRKVADVAPNGQITAYTYNANDQVIASTAYATLLTSAQLISLNSQSSSTAPVRLSSLLPASNGNDRWSWNIYDADGRLIESIDALGYATAYTYDNASRLIATTQYANPLSSQLAGFRTTPPVKLVLPTADATNDRMTRTLYNADGRVAGTLDADGYLTQVFYDDTGLKTHTVAFATQVSSTLWAAGTLAQLVTSAGTSANDIHAWWVYDNAGNLRATIDGEGDTTRYDNYTAAGFVGTITKGQKLDPATLIATPPTMANLPAASGALEVTAFTYDGYGHVLTKTLTLQGGTLETTIYTYDGAYNLTSVSTNSSTSATGSADGRKAVYHYDGIGRQIGVLSGIGSASLAAGPSQAQIDTLWSTNKASYGSMVAYDLAGRKIAETDADGNRTLYYYNSYGQLAYQVDGSGGVVQYGYDVFNEVSATTRYVNRIAAATLSSLSGGAVTTTLLNAITTNVGDSQSGTNHNLDGTISSTSDALGASTAYTYDAFGDVTKVTDPLLIQTTKTYSRRGLLLTSTADPTGLNLKTSYAYDAFGRTASVTDAANGVQTTTYDRAGRVKTQVDALGKTASYTYDAFGHVLTLTDRTGATTTYAYTLFDRQVTVTDANNISTVTTRNAYGQTVKIVDGTGAATSYAYDADGNLLSVTDPLGLVTTSAFDHADLLTSTTSPRGIVTSYTYDGAGRTLTRTVDSVAGGLQLKTTWAYDGEGRTLTVTDPSNLVTSYSYDLDGRTLTSVVDPGGLNLTTTWSYDAGGRMTRVTSPAGVVTQSTYDNAGRLLTSVVDPGTSHLNLTTSLAYDKNGNLLSRTDAAGNITRYVYDADNRQAYAIDEAGAVTANSFDNEGRVVQTTRYAVLNTSTGVQSLSQMQAWVTANTNANDRKTRAVYDAGGRQLYAIDARGAVMAMIYDNAGRVTQQTQYATLYTATAIPILSDMTTWVGNNAAAGSLTQRTAYDADGRTAYTIDRAGLLTGFTYDSDGNVTRSVQYAKAFTATGAQTKAQIDTWVGTAGNTSASDRTTLYTYDNAGRVSTVVDAGGYETAYSYDQDGRVTQSIRYPTNYTTLPLTPPAGSVVTRHAYDAAGRLAYDIDPTGMVTAYSYDADGRITMAVQYATPYLATGVQTAAQVLAWTGTTPVTANAAYNVVTRNAYDAAGRQAYSINGSGTVTAYTYNGTGLVTKTIVYATPYDSTLTGVQTVTAIGTWISTHGASGDRTSTYAYDAAGNLKTVVDAAGITTQNWYNNFGELTASYLADGTADVVATTQGYDADGRVTYRSTADTTADVSTVSYLRDSYGRVLIKTDGRNNTTTYTYDGEGRVLTVRTAEGNQTTNVYDSFGDLVKVSDPLGRPGYFYYDNLGRQTLQVDAAGYATATGYDLSGQVLSVTRYATATSGATVATPPTPTVNTSKDNTTSFTRDAAGRVLTSTDGNGYLTTYTYDAFGNRKTMTNAAGAQVTYTYDARGLMLSQTTPASSVTDNSVTTQIAPATTTAYQYDAFGNRIKMIEAQGLSEQRTTNYVYDKDDRLISQSGDAVTVTTISGTTSSVTPTQTFTYDRRGNQITATDANGAVTVTYYDKQDRKTAQVDAVGTLTTWTYDKNDNVLSQRVYGDALTLPVSTTTVPAPVNASNYRETDYAYDKDNRLKTTSVLGVETGSWTSGAWSTQTGALTTTSVYDADGNVIQETDANGNSRYTWYDKLGRKIASVDEGGYMTSYVLDAEGNVTSQTQYATALAGPFTAGGNPPSAPTADATNDRTTTFTYDHDGQRLTQTRKSLSYSTVSGNSVTAQSGDATVTFTYNSQGQVTSETEATGDVSTWTYDTLGRVMKMTTASGATNAMTTLSTYDGLGNLRSTVAGYGTAGAETTTYAYGAGGRLSSKTDAMGFVISYGYDANGNTTLQSYTRVKSDGTSVQEASQTSYDKLGRVTLTAKATWSGTAWVSADTTDTYYDTYGEVVARGTNTGGALSKAQQYSDYDAAGRVWRTNMDDGVVKVFAYDKNGNQTLQIQSLGTTDLRTVANLDAAIAASGTAKTYNIYDKRNELVDVKKPVSANADGTITSASSVTSYPGTGIINVINNTYPAGPNTVYVTQVIAIINIPAWYVPAAGSGTTLSFAINGTTVTPTSTGASAGMITYTFSPIYTATQYNSPPPAPPSSFNLTIIQTTGTTQTQLASKTLATPQTGGTATNLGLEPYITLTNAAPAAANVKMFVRPAGSSGGYTLVDATPVTDVNGILPGAYNAKLPQPALNTNWDIKWLVTDAAGNVIDAKGGGVSIDASGATWITTRFDPVPVFTATFSGGSYVLTTNPVTTIYSDFLQGFNAFGDVTSQTDARGNTTSFTYDRLGDLIQKTAPKVSSVGENGQATDVNPTDLYYYDKSGRLIGHTDANGNLTTQTLLAGTGYGGTDALITAQYNPTGGGSTSTTYDIFGNALTETDAMGKVTNNTYDQDNRLITVSHQARSGTDLNYNVGVTQLVDTYTYDGLGERIKHTNNVYGTSIAETTDYDLEGRVTRSATFGGQVTSYNYTWTAGTATSRVLAGQGNSGYWTKTTSAFGKSSATNTDVFNRVLSSSDFGAHTSTLTYNLAGQLTHQANSAGQSVDYAYTVLGQLASMTDNATATKTVYTYDVNGNRTLEAFLTTGGSPVYYQDETITYDALNRITNIRESNADISYSYDAVGNRREVRSVYTWTSYGVQDYWYKYDSMNRFVLTKGTLSNGVISVGATGESITYNARGDRTSATYGRDGHVETYAYTSDGYLETVSIGGVVKASRTTDVLGRMTGYTEYQPSTASVLSTRAITYDKDNRVTFETDITNSTDTNGNAVSYTSVITNDYRLWNTATGTYSGTDIGVLVHALSSQTQSNVNGSPVTTTTMYNYEWWSQAKSSTVNVYGSDPNNSNATQWQPGSAAYSYDQNGNLTFVQDGGANLPVNRTITYRTNLLGQVLTRQETNSALPGAKRSFFYANGQSVGDIGNDTYSSASGTQSVLASDIDYAQQLAADQQNAVNAGQSTYLNAATPTGAMNADFDPGYQAYNSSTVEQAGSSYSVTDGDTLQSIAQAVWGDSSLWYVLADANGLDAGATLVAGQSLTVPDRVYNLHNNSGTFKPYNASDALSNTTPTLPQEPHPPAPKQHGCGTIGQILVMIVAIAVVAIVMPYATAAITNLATGSTLSGAFGTAAGVFSGGSGLSVAATAAVADGATLTAAGTALSGGIAGFAGGIASQSFAVATGIQSKFDWSAVAMGTISGAVGGAFGGAKPGFWHGVAHGLESNLATQGVEMAVGLQKKFDWMGLAIAGIAGGVSNKVGEWAEHQAGMTPLSRQVLTGGASLLAGAATRSALTGEKFSKSLRDALPDAISSTIGSIIGDSVLERLQNRGSAQDTAYALPDADIDSSLPTLPEIMGSTSEPTGGGSYTWLGGRSNTSLGDYSFNLAGPSQPSADGLALVGKGDSLLKIANGDPALVAAIFVANDLGLNGNGSPVVTPGELLLIPNLGEAGSSVLKQLDRYGRDLIANNQKGIDAYRALLAQRANDAQDLFQSSAVITSSAACSPFNRYEYNGSILDYDPRALGDWKPTTYVSASMQAALRDARQRVSGVAGAEMAVGQGFTFDFADEGDAWIASGTTAINNYLHQLGLTPGAPYNRFEAYDAVIAADREKIGLYRQDHPIAYTVFNLAGGAANPINWYGGEWALGAKTVGGLMFRGALVGSAVGATYGAGDGTDLQSRFDGATFGFGTGALLGGSTPLAGKYLFKPAAQAAQPWLEKLMSLRLSAEPNTLASFPGNLRISFGNAAESSEFVGPLIGKSGYRTTSELSDAVFTRYQAAADRGYANVQALEAQGLLVPPKGVPLNTYRGQLVDDFARRDIRGFLVQEGIEDSGLVSVNQRLYNSAGTSYRIPDLRVAGTNRIYDLTLGSKSIFTPQVQDFTTFSGGGRVTIVRPSQIGGSKTVF